MSVHSPSEESSDTDSDEEPTLSQTKPLPYPFPPEATSICVEVEAERAGDESPFTSEFNIADYFSADALSDFDLAVASITGSACISGLSENNSSDSRTDETGSSHFVVTPLASSLFAQPATQQGRPQCSGSGSSVVNTSTSSTVSSSFSCATNQAATSSTVSTQCASATTETQLNHQSKLQSQQQQQHRQLPNNSSTASILSKSLTSPTSNRNGGSCGSGSAGVRVFSASTTTSGTITNFGNGHQNGPLPHINNSNNISNSTHVVNNQSTIVLPQKHPPSNLLPGLIAQSKLASLARQQQQTQSQAQQIPTSGEITLNSNR